MIARSLFVITLICAVLHGQAQNLSLPPEWHYTSDGHRLKIGGQEVEGFYQKDVIHTIDLQFSQPDWWELMTVNEATNTRIPVTVIVNGVQYDSVGIRFKGGTSPEIEATQKRSFNLDFNHYISGQNVMGYSTLNLDNASNDPSFMREVIYSELIREHVPTAKANFIHLNINGQDWGLYPNIQQLNSPFLREWFFTNNGSLWRPERPDGLDIGTWGDGTAALNWLGPDTTSYQEYYELERSEQIQPWDDLVRVIDKLNNTPFAQLEDSLNKYMNVDRALWFLACENAFGDRDSYIRKGKDDYMVYYESESGRIQTIELDGRSTMRTISVSWSPFHNADNVNFPLLNRVLSVPSLRQRYLAHLRTIMNEKMQMASFNAVVADHVALIDAEVQSDPRKLYTYEEFLNERIAIQEFVNARRLTLELDPEVSQQGPSIADVQHSVNGEGWASPLATESVNVRATVNSPDGITATNLYYCPGLFGPFTKILMYDDGAHDDGAAGDGIYGATIPAFPLLTHVRYYVEAVSADLSLTASYAPPGAEHDVYIYTVQPITMVDPPVRVNEVMALNTWTVQDNFLEWDDWIELHNPTANQVDLSGNWLSDNASILQKWQFPPGSIIAPFDYMIIWADNQPGQGNNHADFALDAAGESVWLSTPDGTIMDHVLFGPQTANVAYARRPNGYGPFVFQDPTFNLDNDVVSVAELDANSPLRIYPNPAKDLLILESEEQLEIVIHDALLRKIHSEILRGRSSIDISNWASGTYYLRHTSGVQKLIVIR